MPASTDLPGVYRLHMRLDAPARLTIGRLGTFDFPAGRYCYVGSALGGLERRLRRHRSRPERLHWHIDYLLRHACLERIETWPTRERIECAWSQETLALPDARVVAPRFGASDCRCRTHLAYLGVP